MTFRAKVFQMRFLVSNKLVFPSEFLGAAVAGEWPVCGMNCGVSIEFCANKFKYLVRSSTLGGSTNCHEFPIITVTRLRKLTSLPNERFIAHGAHVVPNVQMNVSVIQQR